MECEFCTRTDEKISHLLNHIYEYFGSLIGCSKQGDDIFPVYQGRTSTFEFHKFMDLDKFQMDFFISLVASSASSLGFDPADVAIYKNTLDNQFNTRCAPATAVPGIIEAPELQSICIAENCQLNPNADCAAYPGNGVAVAPKNATATARAICLRLHQ
ncbi:hypothetical protein LCER1_G002768 [Lachnellula cervina]|uniref:Uncharacterized protein n=1 Tax=Lachnellula cervina TaxID=1316786 RepID=A0A7D8Z8D6_9HELO|nr:hypothetical protein LCER1_G002768 [Lachnellula cervina]